MKNILTLLILLSSYGCNSPKSKENTTAANPVVNELPSFTMTLISGEKIKTHSLEGNVILIFYNPDCDHCQREGEAISQRLDAFKKYTLYFIAASSTESIIQFGRNYHLQGFPNVVFAQADGPEVIQEMGPMGTPSMFIYSQGGKLMKKFDGETNVEQIIRSL